MKLVKYKGLLMVVLALIVGLVLGACGRDLTNSGNANSGNANSGTSQNTSGVSGNAPVGSGAPIVPILNQTGATLNPTGNYDQDVRNVVKAARPAVVLIAVTIQQVGGGGVFGGSSQVGQGIGTGSIISADGYILTNNHVIEDARDIRVTLPDGRKYTGRLIGREGSNSDIAVVKIDPKAGETLPTIKLGDSSQLEVGQHVIAIGNALGLPGGPGVTSGVVSNIGRSIQEPKGANLSDLIQTDAAINPGNSGGPLLNLRGEQIGVNTAAAVDPSQNVTADNIGFAININQARKIVDAIINGGRTGQPVTNNRPFMGILPQTMTAGLATRYGLPTDTGVLIARVDDNSPAAKAGWKAGEVLIAMDNKQVATADDLAAIIATRKPGDTVGAIIIGRDGNQRQTQITFGQAPK